MPLPARAGLDAAGHFALAEELSERDFAAAADHYRQAVELDPGLLDAWTNLSCVLLEADQAIEAYAAAQEGLLHHPRAALLHYNLALAQEGMQQGTEALDSYRRALACDPQLLDALFSHGLRRPVTASWKVRPHTTSLSIATSGLSAGGIG